MQCDEINRISLYAMSLDLVQLEAYLGTQDSRDKHGKQVGAGLVCTATPVRGVRTLLCHGYPLRKNTQRKHTYLPNFTAFSRLRERVRPCIEASDGSLSKLGVDKLPKYLHMQGLFPIKLDTKAIRVASVMEFHFRPGCIRDMHVLLRTVPLRLIALNCLVLSMQLTVWIMRFSWSTYRI